MACKRRCAIKYVDGYVSMLYARVLLFENVNCGSGFAAFHDGFNKCDVEELCTEDWGERYADDFQTLRK